MAATSALRRLAVASVVVWALVASAAGAAPGHAHGPDPTEEVLLAPSGPFPTASVAVPSSVAGFGGGVIHHPTGTTGTTFGAVAIAPGFLGSSVNYAWMGPRLASHEFVVLLMDTNGRLDNAASRGQQLVAALSYLTGPSPVAGLVDPDRLAVAGHSMGGGGALEAANVTEGLRAVMALQPFNATWTSWSTWSWRRRVR